MANLEHRFSHPLDSVYEKLVDPDHLRRRSVAAGHKNIEITKTEEDGVIEIRVARDIESDIPRFAKRFINPTNHVVDVLKWWRTPEGGEGTYDVTVSARIHVRGTRALRPEGEGCVFRDTCTPTVDMPLIGKKVAKLVADETAKAIKADCVFTEREIAAG